MYLFCSEYVQETQYTVIIHENIVVHICYTCMIAKQYIYRHATITKSHKLFI